MSRGYRSGAWCGDGHTPVRRHSFHFYPNSLLLPTKHRLLSQTFSASTLQSFVGASVAVPEYSANEVPTPSFMSHSRTPKRSIQSITGENPLFPSNGLNTAQLGFPQKRNDYGVAGVKKRRRNDECGDIFGSVPPVGFTQGGRVYAALTDGRRPHPLEPHTHVPNPQLARAGKTTRTSTLSAALEKTLSYKQKSQQHVLHIAETSAYNSRLVAALPRPLKDPRGVAGAPGSSSRSLKPATRPPRLNRSMSGDIQYEQVAGSDWSGKVAKMKSRSNHKVCDRMHSSGFSSASEAPHVSRPRTSDRKSIPTNKFYSSGAEYVRRNATSGPKISLPRNFAHGHHATRSTFQRKPLSPLPRPVGEVLKPSRDERVAALNAAEREKFRAATKGISKSKVAAKIEEANIVLRGHDIVRLRGRRWLNDEVINGFAALINKRSKEHFEVVDSANSAGEGSGDTPKTGKDEEEIDCIFVDPNAVHPGRPRSYMFNSFFYARLCTGDGKYDYDLVRRWPIRAGVDIAMLDLVVFPVNLGNSHWVLAAIDLRQRQFLYLDSMYGSDDSNVLQNLRRWLYDEVQNKHGTEQADRMKINLWDDIEGPSYLPRQGDDGSCGVFTLYVADYLELGKTPDFTQEDIPILRQRAVLYLMRGYLPET